MAEIYAVENLSLDGVMQAPGGEQEDPRDGFPYGGWARPYMDEVAGKVMAEGMRRTGAMLFGRRTYEHMFSFWPKQTDGNPYTEVLNKTQKYVVSRTLAEPLPWRNSTLLRDIAAVAAVKADVEGDLCVLGSGELIRSLVDAGLLDGYTLQVSPITLGTGRRLFGDAYNRFRLVSAEPTTTGVIIASYEVIR
ncbi:MAG TPA: dihydrofolate reductase family protein [Asanoa sp.]